MCVPALACAGCAVGLPPAAGGGSDGDSPLPDNKPVLSVVMVVDLVRKVLLRCSMVAAPTMNSTIARFLILLGKKT